MLICFFKSFPYFSIKDSPLVRILISTSFRKILILYFILVVFLNQSFSQLENQELKDDFWSSLESKATELEPSSTTDEIILLVKGKCEDDYNCQYSYYDKCRHLFEIKFQLEHAISMCTEMLHLAQEAKNLEDEGHARMELARFYDALGEFHLGMEHLQLASTCFEKTGNLSREHIAEYYHLEASLEFVDPIDILNRMDDLLEEVDRFEDTELTANINMRMIRIKNLFKPEDVKYHIRSLEDIAERNPNTKLATDISLTTHQYHGGKAVDNQDYETAIFHFNKAVECCRSISSKWQEVNSMQLLSHALIESGNLAAALDTLILTEQKAQSIQVENLLARNFELKSRVYEEIGQFEEALLCLQKKYEYQALYDKRGEGFNPEKYYLQREKDILSTGLKNQELENELQSARMKFLYVLMFLAVISVLFFIYSFKREQGRKAELEKQNNFIKKQSERLKELDRLKSRFFANISHEFRTPLTLILGPIKKLQSDNTLKNDQAKLVNMVDDASQQLDHLVKDILDLSNLELGKLEINKSEVYLYDYLKNYFNKFNELANSKNIKYTIEVNIDENLKAEIDRQKTKQLINNILSNAFKYTSKGGEVTIDAIVYNSQLEINITDTGYGIPKEDIPHLFDRYFQTNNELKPAIGGFGIGLALCKEIIDALGGRIKVDSDLGIGTSFHLEWPIESFHLKKSNDIVTQSSKVDINQDKHLIEKVFLSNSKNKQKLLIVEDNIKLFEYINLILKRNYEIHHAENGLKALEFISKNEVDLIISDLMMPVLDGYGLLEKLKEDKELAKIPVIMVTAKFDNNDKIKALRMGVDDYIVKPFEEYELLRSVEKLLKNKSVRVAEVESVVMEEDAEMDDKDHDWLMHLESFVDKSLTNSMMNVTYIATNLAISESSLLRKTKRIVGLTPQAYIKERRLQSARAMFEQDNTKTIQEVAFAVGYLDARTLSRNFKTRFGKLPSNFINETIASEN